MWKVFILKNNGKALFKGIRKNVFWHFVSKAANLEDGIKHMSTDDPPTSRKSEEKVKRKLGEKRIMNNKMYDIVGE